MTDVLFILLRWVFPPIKIMHLCRDEMGFCDRFAHFRDYSPTISAISAPAQKRRVTGDDERDRPPQQIFSEQKYLGKFQKGYPCRGVPLFWIFTCGKTGYCTGDGFAGPVYIPEPSHQSSSILTPYSSFDSSARLCVGLIYSIWRKQFPFLTASLHSLR